MGRIHAILSDGTVVTDVEVCFSSLKTHKKPLFLVWFLEKYGNGKRNKEKDEKKFKFFKIYISF